MRLERKRCFPMPFHDSVSPRVLIHPRTSGGTAAVFRRFILGGVGQRDGTFLPPVENACGQNIYEVPAGGGQTHEHAPTHAHAARTEPRTALKMTGMHPPRTPGWGRGGGGVVRSAAVFQLRASYGRCSRRCSSVLSLTLFCMFVQYPRRFVQTLSYSVIPPCSKM